MSTCRRFLLPARTNNNILCCLVLFLVSLCFSANGFSTTMTNNNNIRPLSRAAITNERLCSNVVTHNTRKRRRRNTTVSFSRAFQEATTSATTLYNLSSEDIDSILLPDTTTNNDGIPILLFVSFALVIGFAAQGWINTMIKGDQGLGAYLQDGSGYSKSGFKTMSDDDATKSDPLPWLKLPQLDFVEVAGQETTQPKKPGTDDLRLMEHLELIRVDMNECLQMGKMEQAEVLRQELEQIMKENGMEYNQGD